jgi:hypothetical protein
MMTMIIGPIGYADKHYVLKWVPHILYIYLYISWFTTADHLPNNNRETRDGRSGGSAIILGADSIIGLLTQTTMAKDELEEINGLKPKVWLQDGEEREVNSQSRYKLVALTLCQFFAYNKQQFSL